MSSGVAWIDRKVGELRGAREFLEGIGMAPSAVGGGDPRGRYAFPTGWRVPHWIGQLSDAQLIEFARERGFRG